MRTFYDELKFTHVQTSFGGLGQQNLRSRVASIALYDEIIGVLDEDDYQAASHYT